MNVFLKAIAGVFISLILWLCLEKSEKNISLLLTLAACVLLLASAVSLLNPVITFVEKLRQVGELNKEYIKVILKVVGVGLISEISALICKDAGNESLGKALQIMSAVIVLLLSIPIFEKLLELLNDILGTI